MFLGIIAKFSEKKDASEMRRRVEKLNNSDTKYEYDGCSCESRKRTKVPCFPYSPTFHEDYDLDSKNKNKNVDWLV